MDEETALTLIAAAVVDIWMGGDQAWRARLHDSDFLESADWQNAMEIARAAHSVIAGKIAELEDWAFEQSRLHHRLAHENEPLRTEHIASSATYRELGLKLRERAALAQTKGTDR